MAVSQRGAWEAWLLFFLEGVRSQAEDASRRIGQIQTLRLKTFEMFAADRSRKKLGRLVDYLIRSPITSIPQAEENLEMGSYTTIQRNIEKLEALGIVREVTGNQRNRIYHAEEILKVLEERV